MSEKLAISGGAPILKRADYLNWPVITDDDRKFIAGCSTAGSCRHTGPSRRVAARIRAFTGPVCLTTCGGTAALHMGLAAVDVGPGDEVIVLLRPSPQPLCPAPDGDSHVDIEPRTYTLDPASSKRRSPSGPGRSCPCISGLSGRHGRFWRLPRSTTCM